MDAEVTLFLAGDVMLGRGVDQLLPHPCDPELHERYVQDAREYLSLAEGRSGPLPESVGFEYVWGEGLEILGEERPDVRLVNLETAVTRSREYWRGKGIHYRVSPENAAALEAAEIDVCSLANNHVLDWGYPGLEETLRTLEERAIGYCGAGRDGEEAWRPTAVEVGEGHRVLVVGLAATDAGVSGSWRAGEGEPGVALLGEFSGRGAEVVGEKIDRHRRPGDLVVASIHWGGNWGWEVPDAHVRLGRALVDEAGVDLVHGHSSHHVKALEIHRGHPILYGCGDLVTDYEGIGGHEQFRGELGMMYFPRLDAETGRLAGMTMRPTRLERLRLTRPSVEEVDWLVDVLEATSERFGTEFRRPADDRITVRR